MTAMFNFFTVDVPSRRAPSALPYLLRRAAVFAAAAVLPLVLALDEAQQVVDLRHQLAVGAEDFPGVVQARPWRGRAAGGPRPGPG